MVDRNVGSHSFKLVTGYTRLDELNSKLDKFSYRVLKEDCLDLPSKIYMKRSVSLTSEQLKAYTEMKKHAVTVLEDSQTSAASALAQMVRLHQITCGHLTVIQLFFIGNPRTGGYGLTLTASHTVVYYSNSYDLEIRLQSEDRAHRISQTEKVTYIDLLSEGTVDEFIVKNLRSKINLANKVLGEDLKKWLI